MIAELSLKEEVIPVCSLSEFNRLFLIEEVEDGSCPCVDGMRQYESLCVISSLRYLMCGNRMAKSLFEWKMWVLARLPGYDLQVGPTSGRWGKESDDVSG